MAYTLTPAERRARAQAVREQRNSRYTYSNYVKEVKQAQSEQASALRQAQIDEENEKNNQNFLVRGLSTIGDFATNVITGAVKGLEGIYDLGATVVGGIGGIFSQDFQNSVKEHVAYDWTTNIIGNPLQEWTKYSYLTDGGIVESVASGIGQMLPSVAVSVATGGLGAPAAVSQAASLGTLGVSAAGNSTEQAYNDGAGYWQGLGYGLASGAVEVATEKLGGGFTSNVFGRGLLDGVGKTVADTGIRRIARSAIEEGAEEVISEVANPALKSIYKGKAAFEEYKDPEYWLGVGEAGLVGGLTSLAYGGTVGRVINSAKGINEDISDSITQVQTLEKKRSNLFADDRLTEQNDTKISEGIRSNYQNVETALKKASDKARAKYIQNYGLENIFEADGSMKADFAARIGLQAQTDTATQETTQTPLASLDTRYYHPSLRGQEQQITQRLAEMGTKVYSGELTETEQANYKKFKKVFNALSQKGLVQPDFVLSESNDKFYSYLDDKTIVMGKDALESDLWQRKIIHEVEHFAEDTQEWADYATFIFNETDTSEAIKAVVGNQGYGITQADADGLMAALAQGNLSDKQRLLASEVMATQSEVLFGNEQMIERLTTQKRSLARKLLDRIKNFIKTLKAKTPEEKAIIKKLETAQKLFEKALSKGGTKYAVKTAKKSAQAQDKAEEARTQDEQLSDRKTTRRATASAQYSLKDSEGNTLSEEQAEYFKDSKVRDSKGRLKVVYHATNARFTQVDFKKGAQGLFWFTSSKENFENGNTVAAGVRDKNNVSIMELYADIKNPAGWTEYDKYGISQLEYMGYDGAILENDDGTFDGFVFKSPSQIKAITNTRPTKSKDIRYSLKDSQGNDLTEQQAEFFKDSKVRDDDGNLLVVYHGTKNGNFTVFEYDKSRQTGDDFGKAYYFTTNLKNAKGYAKDNQKDARIEQYNKEREALTWKIVSAVRNGESAEVVQDLRNQFDNVRVDGKTLHELMADTDYDTGGSVFNVYLNLVNPLIADADGKYYFKVYPKYFEQARANNSDGIIIKNVNDSSVNGVGLSDVYIAFDENQIKLTTNKNPTFDDDIRYSLKDSESKGFAYPNNYNATDTDNEYLKALNEGNTERAQAVVNEAAAKAGYTDHLYHGTKNFGFTVFDSRKSDDGLSFFLSRSLDIARSYAVTDKIRSVSQKNSVNVAELSDAEIVSLLNENADELDGIKDRWQLFDRNDYDRLNRSLVERLESLQKRVHEERVMYADKMAEDFFSIDELTHKQLFTLEKVLNTEKFKKGDYTGISTPLWCLVEQSDAFSDIKTELSQLERDIRVVRKYMGQGILDGVSGKGKYVLQDSLGGYSLSFYTVEQARAELGKIYGRGIYDLFGNSGRQLIIDAENQDWSKIKGWIRAIEPTLEGTYVVKYGNEYILLDRYSEQVVNNGRLEITDSNKEWIAKASDEQIHLFLISKATTSLRVLAEGKSSTRDIALWAKNLGYDSVLIKNLNDWGGNGKVSETGDVAIYFDSSRLKSADVVTYDDEGNVIPLSRRFDSDNQDIRYSLKDKYFYKLSDGQIKKILADYTRPKVYSKVEAEQIISNVLGNYMSFGDKYGVISGKTRKEVIDMLWCGLNTADKGKQAHVALDVAEYIIQNAALENLYDDINAEEAMLTISLLKPYLHNIDLSGIRGEIRYHYDKNNSPYALWGKRRGTEGIAPDKIAQELAEQGLQIETEHPAEIFFEIDEAYRNAVQDLKKQARDMVNNSFTKEQRAQLKQDIAKEVLRGFDYAGKASKLAAIIEEYSNKAKAWKEKYTEERNKNKAINRLLYKTQKLKDLKLGTFLNATQFKVDIFKGSIEKLGQIKFRGYLNETGTRKIVGDLLEWYSKDNPILEGVYDDEIRSMLETVAHGEGVLGLDEIRALDNIVGYFVHLVENFNKVYREGRYVEALPFAKSYIDIMRHNTPVKVGVLHKAFEKYIRTFGDPMTVMRYMDRYDNGFFSETLNELREGAVNASVMELEFRQPIDDFLAEHKTYAKNLAKRTINYGGVDMSVQQAMLLYMTLNREQALAGLTQSGFTVDINNQSVRVRGFAPDSDLTVDELKRLAAEQQALLKKQFSDLDIQFIEIAEKIFNENCKEAKRKTDMDMKGYTNVVEDYYVPIRRANIAHSVDTSNFFNEMSRVSNASFNRDTVKGAKGELYIEGLDSVLDRHIRAVAQYANLSAPIDNYNKLFNLDVGENSNKPISIKTESTNVWREGNDYFKKLISDIQGIPVVKGEGNRAIAFIRSSYAKYQLGANPKVWVTQLSSFASAGSILDFDSITKGLGINGNDVDEYCPLAKVRNNDNTAAMAQGVLDNIDKVGNVLMKPIGKVDRLVIKKLFGACQAQVQKNGGAKIGTKENKQAAGKLLTRVILETQQNALATERSAAMRSGNELMRTITMFSSDAMKVVGRVIDSIGEVTVLKQKRKAATDETIIKQLDKAIKEANKKARKSASALIGSAAFMALVAQLFRWLYNKDDEDENLATTIAVDAFGNLLGGLPLIKDIYAKLVEGYDLDNYAYSTINNLLDSVQNIFTAATDIIEGDTSNLARNIRNVLYAVGQLFGIPVRNVYNVGYGLINRFSPSTAYKIDDMFYDKSYRADLNKAIEQDDDEMITTIIGIMLDENVGTISDATSRQELDKLTKAGYDVIPQGAPSSITYEDEEIVLTSRQRAEFKEVYSVAYEALASLVNLSQYHSATDEVKAKAINYIYDVYYNLAVENLLGVDLENKTTLFAEAIDIEKLAIIIATARTLTADLDGNGNAISGSKKAKVQAYINSLSLTAAQKYMIMGYLGYSNAKGETQVKSYINRLSLTSDEKKLLLEYSGYAA